MIATQASTSLKSNALPVSTSRRASPLLAGSGQSRPQSPLEKVTNLIKAHKKAVAEARAASKARNVLEDGGHVIDWKSPLTPAEQWYAFIDSRPGLREAIDRGAEALEAEGKALTALLQSAPSIVGHQQAFTTLAKYVTKLMREAEGGSQEGASPAHRCLAAIAGLRITSRRGH